jgi:hypothetical protein
MFNLGHNQPGVERTVTVRVARCTRDADGCEFCVSSIPTPPSVGEWRVERTPEGGIAICGTHAPANLGPGDDAATRWPATMRRTAGKRVVCARATPTQADAV